LLAEPDPPSKYGIRMGGPVPDLYVALSGVLQRSAHAHSNNGTAAPPAPSRVTCHASRPSPVLLHHDLRRSAISLGAHVQGTVAALGLRARMQTVYRTHTPEAAGMILAMKELVEVRNVLASAVRTAGQQRVERKATCGFVVVGWKVGSRRLVSLCLSMLRRDAHLNP
jgi:large subunit ribosomal protein L30